MKGRRHEPCTPGSPNPSSLQFSKLFNGVRRSPSTCVNAGTLQLTSAFIAEVMGRLDHLVEAVYDRFKDRYFKDESMYRHNPLFSPSISFSQSIGVLVDLSGTK